MDRNKIIQMLIILAAIIVIATSFSKMLSRDSMSLADYARLNASSTADPQKDDESALTESSLATAEPSESEEAKENTSDPGQSKDHAADSVPQETLPTGAALNGDSQEENRYILKEGFYYEPISEKLCRYMTGVSYPAAEGTDDPFPAPSFDDLLYVHILHYDFQGDVIQGELICNSAVALDLLEIFYELYRNEYKLESMLLTDEYNGDELLSRENNNSFCFSCSSEADEHALRHSQGLAVDINPFYNPCVTYAEDGSEQITPSEASGYADRSAGFPYKIDENDLCYKLFIQHGFTWGGNWNDGKCYQHFQKSIP